MESRGYIFIIHKEKQDYKLQIVVPSHQLCLQCDIQFRIRKKESQTIITLLGKRCNDFDLLWFEII